MTHRGAHSPPMPFSIRPRLPHRPPRIRPHRCSARRTFRRAASHPVVSSERRVRRWPWPSRRRSSGSSEPFRVVPCLRLPPHPRQTPLGLRDVVSDLIGRRLDDPRADLFPCSGALETRPRAPNSLAERHLRRVDTPAAKPLAPEASERYGRTSGTFWTGPVAVCLECLLSPADWT